jgi:hypothetical protein
MEEAGWIRPQWVTKENGQRARIYELGASGKKQLQAEESRWRTVTAAVDRLRTGLICRFGRVSGEGDRSGVLAPPPLAILITALVAAMPAVIRAVRIDPAAILRPE